jgi:hypothetical protein
MYRARKEKAPNEKGKMLTRLQTGEKGNRREESPLDCRYRIESNPECRSNTCPRSPNVLHAPKHHDRRCSLAG